jgi:hypothetical protein
MARWRLRNSHYLNILDPDTGEPTEWEYKEQDATTGRMGRKIYHVPCLLDPNDPGYCNYPGEIVVCHDGKGERKDIVFFGDPTPDMEALDEEAEEISAALQSRWKHPIDTLPANGGMNSKESAFMQAMMENFSKALPNASVPSQTEFNAMKKQLEEMQALMVTLTPSSPIPAETKRRA